MIGGGVAGVEYLLTAAFSATAAVFSYLAKRHGKTNEAKLETIEHQTNGELSKKISEAVKKAVSHDELVRAVSEEAIRDYLDGLLEARLNDEDYAQEITSRISDITERRKGNGP